MIVFFSCRLFWNRNVDHCYCSVGNYQHCSWLKNLQSSSLTKQIKWNCQTHFFFVNLWTRDPSKDAAATQSDMFHNRCEMRKQRICSDLLLQIFFFFALLWFFICSSNTICLPLPQLRTINHRLPSACLNNALQIILHRQEVLFISLLTTRRQFNFSPSVRLSDKTSRVENKHETGV